MKIHGWTLEFASRDLQNDREIVLEAVKNNGWALQNALEDLKNDRVIVLKAVKINGYALQYDASEDLKKDR